MNEQTLTIPFEFPSLNETIENAKGHWAKYALKKKHFTRLVVLYTKKQKLTAISSRVNVTFRWYCSTRRQDPDNIASAKKFILDGLVQAGILKNDGWKHIEGFTDEFYIDKANPRVVVNLKEVGQ